MSSDLERLAGEWQEKYPFTANALKFAAQTARAEQAPEFFNHIQATKNFSDQARQGLKAEGYIVYSLLGKSIKELREGGRPFWSNWHRDCPDFEAVRSMISEVAINPDPKKFFLPKANNKTLDEQLEFVEEHSQKLGTRIQDVRVILGEAPDYCELAFAHLDATKERLFGEKFNFDYTRTKTRVESCVAHVGAFRSGGGLDVVRWDPSSRFGALWAAPLVVPA